jgi:hypothetical protein
MGKTIADPRRFVFGARNRADDMFEVSRSPTDTDNNRLTEMC